MYCTRTYISSVYPCGTKQGLAIQSKDDTATSPCRARVINVYTEIYACMTSSKAGSVQDGDWKPSLGNNQTQIYFQI